MPGVTCGSCQQSTNVSFHRGTRLADIPCPSCGKTDLHTATAGRANRHKGRTYEHCAACGKRGLGHAHPPFEWEPKYRYRNRDHPGPYPAGTPACWSEEAVPAARTRHEAIHGHLVELLGARGNWATDEERAALEAAATGQPPERGECPACKPWQEPGIYGGWAYHVNAYAFERGTALVASCDWCGNTILLATLARAEP